MNILHIFKNTNEKFYNPFISFINEQFNPNDHYFMIEKYTDNNKEKNFAENVELVYKRKYLKMIKRLYTSDKIILHSLMSPRVMIILFLQPWLLRKTYWTIWGSDLYHYKFRQRNIKSDIYEIIRKKIIKNVIGLITHIKGDYELAKKWYGAQGKYYYSFMYPSNLYKDYSLNKVINQNDKIYIQIGNSADPSNNHLEVLDKLLRYKDMDIEIICSLSYGDKVYAKKVINYGSENFGDKFVPITEFIPFDKYLDILAKIDIAIFNHKRQQAMGNITTLLGLGKKVYIREEITTWQFCVDHDLKVYSANGSYEDLFEKMDEMIKRKNVKNVKNRFSEEKLVEDWNAIFKGDS